MTQAKLARALNCEISEKSAVIVQGASHTDLYDGGENNAIPFDKLADFFGKYLK